MFNRVFDDIIDQLTERLEEATEIALPMAHIAGQATLAGQLAKSRARRELPCDLYREAIQLIQGLVDEFLDDLWEDYIDSGIDALVAQGVELV